VPLIGGAELAVFAVSSSPPWLTHVPAVRRTVSTSQAGDAAYGVGRAVNATMVRARAVVVDIIVGVDGHRRRRTLSTAVQSVPRLSTLPQKGLAVLCSTVRNTSLSGENVAPRGSKNGIVGEEIFRRRA
jgi:hypothetical protein